MRVAIIGWGSLIYDRGVLRLVDGWHKNGPPLPVEFARISGNGTISLVISPEHGTTVTTYWAESMEGDLPLARENLCDRERTPDIENYRRCHLERRSLRPDTLPEGPRGTNPLA